MPLGDAASGCLELVARFVLDVIAQGIGELLWPWCQVTGDFIVWLLTLGRLRLSDRHEVLAGIIGLAFYVVLIVLVVMWVSGGGSTTP